MQSSLLRSGWHSKGDMLTREQFLRMLSSTSTMRASRSMRHPHWRMLLAANVLKCEPHSTAVRYWKGVTFCRCHEARQCVPGTLQLTAAATAPHARGMTDVRHACCQAVVTMHGSMCETHGLPANSKVVHGLFNVHGWSPLLPPCLQLWAEFLLAWRPAASVCT